MVGVAAGIMLIPGAPLGLITTSVQALAGLLLPSASVFLLLLCNDGEVLGPWVNPRWLNGVAAVIVAVLLILSGTSWPPLCSRPSTSPPRPLTTKRSRVAANGNEL